MSSPQYPPGCWPRLMPARIAAAYVGEKSIEAFQRAVGTLYPLPINVPGRGDRWTKEALDRAIDAFTPGHNVAGDAADLL